MRAEASLMFNTYQVLVVVQQYRALFSLPYHVLTIFHEQSPVTAYLAMFCMIKFARLKPSMRSIKQVHTYNNLSLRKSSPHAAIGPNLKGECTASICIVCIIAGKADEDELHQPQTGSSSSGVPMWLVVQLPLRVISRSFRTASLLQ